MAYLLHRIWQKHGKYPHEIYALDTRHKAFIFASELLEIDAEEKERKRIEEGGR